MEEGQRDRDWQTTRKIQFVLAQTHSNGIELRVVDTHSILKYDCLILSFYEGLLRGYFT